MIYHFRNNKLHNFKFKNLIHKKKINNFKQKMKNIKITKRKNLNLDKNNLKNKYKKIQYKHLVLYKYFLNILNNKIKKCNNF